MGNCRYEHSVVNCHVGAIYAIFRLLAGPMHRTHIINSKLLDVARRSNEPEMSPNYSQTINIKGVDDLGYASRLGFRVLKEAYQVSDFGVATFTIG